MKPHFARYLPVEGEIKVGDIVQANQDSLVGKYGPLLQPLSKAEVDDKEYSKVSLFLCSRDIKDGDSFYMDEQHGPYIAENYPQPGNPSNYKVIGLISPEAGWVKEGDEFDEDEVKKYLIAPDGMAILPKAWGEKLKKDRPDIKIEYAYQIKGPCGHFH